MRLIKGCVSLAGCSVLAMLTVSALVGQEQAEKPAKDPKQAAKLEFMRKEMQALAIEPTRSGDNRDLKINPQPILRYNDPARNIADSAVWRIGSKGRPIALVTSEVYGPFENSRYQMNHEFLAIDNPRLTIQCGNFRWMPPADTTLKFQKFDTPEKPSEKAPVRLSQMKRLSLRFAMRQEYEGNKIELRLRPTPIDRYTPSDKPRADGAIFAAVWGVNPEVLLFIETDGETWSYAFCRSSSANLWATLDGAEVWHLSGADVTPQLPYSITPNTVRVPAETFKPDEKK